VHLIGSTSVRFDQCDIAGVGDYAVWVNKGSRDVALMSCQLHDLGTGGVRVGVNTHNNDNLPLGKECVFDQSSSSCKVTEATAVLDVLVHNCTITSGGHVFRSGTPVFVQQAQAVNITHNDIGNFPYAAISLGWNWNYYNQSFSGGHNVVKNHLHDFGSLRSSALGDAMACVYTLGRQSGTYVGYNLCHDVYAFYTGGYCLSQDQGLFVRAHCALRSHCDAAHTLTLLCCFARQDPATLLSTQMCVFERRAPRKTSITANTTPSEWDLTDI
jgi:hypothetical protein